MTNERENFFQPLTLVDYDIAGNSFRAYYDADKKLVFVIDFLISDIKPNVLLVINPVGDRKWDDILENDYGVDLETVRPKKDNKYQKLDIEYAGLAEYDNLIAAYEAGKILNSELNALMEFRHVAATRSAIERLDAAELTVSRSRETIDKTEVKLSELQEKLKTLRAKLADAKRAIGKEPTKQSASKILRIESQIDSTMDKIKRAKKRLNNAQNRLSAAEDEIETAQHILNKLKVELPAEPAPAQIVVAEPAPVPVITENTEYEEPKADNMSDDIKPLFDTDPNIIDEEIAFKPIDFGEKTVSSEPVAPVVNITQNFAQPMADVEKDDNENVPMVQESPSVPAVEPVPVEEYVSPLSEYKENTFVEEPEMEEQENIIQPLSFTPPTSFETVSNEENEESEENKMPQPLFEGFTPIPLGEEQEDLSTWEEPVIDMPTVYSENNDTKKQEQYMTDDVSEYKPEHVVAESDDVEAAPITSSLRPVSPISGAADVAAPVVAVASKKPTMLYYVLLFVLIILSVFTLWVYQNSANDTMPELGAKTEPVAVVEESVSVAEPQPDVVDTITDVVPEEIVAEQTIEPEVIVPDVEPTEVDVTEPVVENVAIEPTVVPVTQEPETVPEPVIQKVENTGSPFINISADTIFRNVPDAPQPEPVKVPTEEEILASKPAYGVSQTEDVIVATPESESGIVIEEQSTAIVEEIGPEFVTEYEEAVEEFTEEQEVCADGNAPDADGCCSGEELVLMPDGERVCCIQGTDECFPPM